MNFADKTILRLADSESRSALFDQTSLAQLLSAAYDTESQPPNGPFNAVFDSLEMGFDRPHDSHGKAKLYGNGIEISDIILQLSDWHAGNAFHAEAFWRGSIIARSVTDNSVVEDVTMTWPPLSEVDAAVTAANGGELPTDPVALENARRVALIDLFGAGMDVAGAMNQARLDKVLTRMQVESVGELLALGIARPSLLEVTFSPVGSETPIARSYPINAAILVMEAEFSLRQALLNSKWLARHLEGGCVGNRAPSSLLPRRQYIVIWVIPEEVFDDEDWPGATSGMSVSQRRAARRARAGEWLAREGIGLAAATG